MRTRLRRFPWKRSSGVVLRLLIAALFVFAAYHLFQAADYHRRTKAVGSSSLLEFLLPASAFAETVGDKAGEKPFTFRDGQLLFRSAERRYEAARNIWRVSKNPNNSDFLSEVDGSVDEYGQALFAWNKVYENMATEDPVNGLEKARILDAVNHALWRLLPHMDEGKLEGLRNGMRDNWLLALSAIRAYENVKKNDPNIAPLRSAIERNLELFRRKAKEEKEKQSRQSGQNKSEEDFHFPENKEGSKQSAAERAEKADAEKRVKQAMQEEGKGRGETEKDPPPMNVPGLGLLPLPKINL